MANYFKRLPNIKYQDLNDLNSPETKFDAKNIFRRGKLREDILNQTTFFENYFILSDERPDQVADKIYDDPDLDWVILITNNIVNIQEEWPMETNSYNNYLLEKYGTYEAIYEISHYESKEIRDSSGVIVLPKGLTVTENHVVEYFDPNTETHVTFEDCSNEVTNYMKEERIQEQKRSIRILKAKYLNIVFQDMEEIMTYEKGSTGYISRTLKDTESV